MKQYGLRFPEGHALAYPSEGKAQGALDRMGRYPATRGTTLIWREVEIGEWSDV